MTELTDWIFVLGAAAVSWLLGARGQLLAICTGVAVAIILATSWAADLLHRIPMGDRCILLVFAAAAITSGVRASSTAAQRTTQAELPPASRKTRVDGGPQ